MSSSNKTNKSSWIEDTEDSGFPLSALPYGIADPGGARQVVLRIGAYVLGLADCAKVGCLTISGLDPEAFRANSLNPLLAHEKTTLIELRNTITDLLSDPTYRKIVEPILRDANTVNMQCPLAPGDFIDFYSSYHHAVRSMAAAGASDPEPPKNWFAMPVGYHSRTSTIVGSEAAIQRPRGQRYDRTGPSIGLSRSLDFELELGFVACGPRLANTHISPDQFGDRVFGVVLLNDWSARDFQGWEARPLGPLLSKSFATQVGNWVMPIEALEGARIHTPTQDTALSYLTHDMPWGFDIDLTVSIETEAMRQSNAPPQVITRTNARNLYWNMAQQLSHATLNGADVRPGDLFGTGTISGPKPDAAGCLLERTNAGRTPIELQNGEVRNWIEEGDRILFEGNSKSQAGQRIDLGGLSGEIIGALWPSIR